MTRWRRKCPTWPSMGRKNTRQLFPHDVRKNGKKCLIIILNTLVKGWRQKNNKKKTYTHRRFVHWFANYDIIFVRFCCRSVCCVVLCGVVWCCVVLWCGVDGGEAQCLPHRDGPTLSTQSVRNEFCLHINALEHA